MKRKWMWIAIGGIGLVFLFLPGYSELQRLREQNKMLKVRIKILKKANRELQKEKELLKNDPEYREKIAREKMGVVKKGEIVYKVGGVEDE